MAKKRRMQRSLADQAAENLRGKQPRQSLAGKLRQDLVAAKPRTVFDTAVALARHAPNPPGPTIKSPMGHVFTFSGLANYLGKTYRNPDQAWRNSRADARAMRNDLLVKECLEARQRATALLPFHVAPEDERDVAQAETATTLSKILEATPRFTEFRRSLLEGMWYGRQGAQFTFGEIGINRKPHYAITSWLPINGDKLAFKYDGTVGIRVGFGYSADTIETAGRNAQIEMVPEYGRAYFLTPEERERVVVHKHMIEDADFEDPMAAGAIHGVGIRSCIYWTWFQKQSVLALLMEYLERSALGFEMWTYPWGNAEAEAKMRTAAQEKVGAGRNIILVPVMPGQEELFKYQRIEPGLEGARMINEIVHQFYNWQIKRYILGQILSSEPEGGGLGSSGLSDIQKDSLMSVVRYDSGNFDDTMSRELLPVLIRLNRHRLPREIEGVRFRYQTNTESSDIKESLDAMQKAWQMGLKIKSEDLYKTTGLSKPQEGDEVLPGQQGEEPGGPGAPDGGDDGGGGDPGDGPKSMLDEIREQLGQHKTLFDQITNPVKRYAAMADVVQGVVDRYASSGVWTGAPNKQKPTKAPKNPTGSKSSADGRWITIGEGEEGGTHIQVDKKGNIIAGPDALKHAGITKLSHFGKKGKGKGKDKKRGGKKDKTKKAPKPESKPAGGMSNQDFVGATTAAAARQESAVGARALGDLAGGDKPNGKIPDNLWPYVALDQDPPEEPAAAPAGEVALREKPATDLSHWRAALAKLEPAQKKSLMQRFSDWWQSLMKEPDTTEYDSGFLGALQRVAAKTFHSKDAADPGAVMRYAQAEIERYAKGDPPQAEELTGKLRLSSSGWLLLDVPDHLAVGAWRALDNPRAQLPFRDGKLNTHISAVRPEEIEQLGGPEAIKDVVGQEFTYQLGEVKSVDPAGWDEMERVWFIECNSPALEEMREGLGLSRLPKEGKFRFHITFAVQPAPGAEKYAKEFEPERYAEKWITLNGDSGDGDGGTPVKVDDDGAIVAGPKGLADKGIKHLDHFGGGKKKPAAKKEPKPKAPRKKAEAKEPAKLHDDPEVNSTAQSMVKFLRGDPEYAKLSPESQKAREAEMVKAAERMAAVERKKPAKPAAAPANPAPAPKATEKAPAKPAPASPAKPAGPHTDPDVASRFINGVVKKKFGSVSDGSVALHNVQAAFPEQDHAATTKMLHDLEAAGAIEFDVAHNQDIGKLRETDILRNKDGKVVDGIRLLGKGSKEFTKLGEGVKSPEKPAAGGASSAQVDHPKFGGDFEAAFDKTMAEKAGGRNFVTIKHLRDAMPQYTPAQFEAGVHELRKAGKFTGTESNGVIPEDHRAAGIGQGDGRIHFLSRKGDPKSAPKSSTSPADAALSAAGIRSSGKSLGDKLDDLQNHDVKTFDALMSDPAAREAGITNNEFIRTLKAEHSDMMRRKQEAIEDGEELRADARAMWDASMAHLRQRGESAVKALRKLGKKKEADFYEQHLPALVREASEDLFGPEKQRNAAEGQPVRYSMFDAIRNQLRGRS